MAFSSFGRRRGFGKPDLPIEVQAKRSFSSARGAFGMEIRIESDELTINIGAASLADYVSRALLMHTAQSIATGQRAAGGSQARLKEGGIANRQAKVGKRDNIRGSTNKPGAITNTLTRGEIKVSGNRTVAAASGKRPARVGTVAVADIYPASFVQSVWLIGEAAQGNEYFAVEGNAERVIDDAVVDYLMGVFDGPRFYDSESTTARENA